jgi:hypothetical protein
MDRPCKTNRIVYHGGDIFTNTIGGIRRFNEEVQEEQRNEGRKRGEGIRVRGADGQGGFRVRTIGMGGGKDTCEGWQR